MQSIRSAIRLLGREPGSPAKRPRPHMTLVAIPPYLAGPANGSLGKPFGPFVFFSVTITVTPISVHRMHKTLVVQSLVTNLATHGNFTHSQIATFTRCTNQLHRITTSNSITTIITRFQRTGLSI
jgi:hypothetical protein